MDSSDEEMLLGSCCFLLNFHQQWKIFKKRKEHGVYHNLFKGMRAVIENHIFERMIDNYMF